MKKQHAILTAIVLALVMVVTVVALAACEKPQTKHAYGLVHGKGYVGQATVVVAGDSLVSAELNEACLPTYVTAKKADGKTAEDADGTYLVTGKYLNHGSPATATFYKTVKFGDVTMTYDTTDVTSGENTVSKGYMVGTKTMLEYFADAANCQKYFEAVAGNSVKVVTANGEKTDIMNAKSLLKTENGYWGTPAANALGWKANVEATCKFVVDNGFTATSKDDFKHASDYDSKKDTATSDKMYNEWSVGTVKTGATWSDIWDYYSLLKTAAGK